MNIVKGITYNLRGLKLAFKTPRLLLLGLIRFAVIVLVTFFSAGLILYYHQDIMNLIWTKPESVWIVWLWHIVTWLVSLMLIGIVTILSYLISQILFSVIIMDIMSRITERLAAEQSQEPETTPLLQQFIYLIKQEVPRATIPLLVILLLMVLGWLTPLGPVITILSSGVAAIFLSWDNTDLVPARRLQPFSGRFRFLLQTLSFHLGFGLLFLIPLLNILFLSYAPVGATLYYIEHHSEGTQPVGP